MKFPPLIAGLILTATLMAIAPASRAEGTNKIGSARPDLLKTCPVSGDKLGGMGTPCTFVYQGQEVKLCCPGCKEDFEKDPAKYLKKIRAADHSGKK